jgi:integrase/recombinase XerD
LITSTRHPSPKEKGTRTQVLSEEEVRRLLWASGNIKHRCIMFLLYSAGMRISELLRLKWEDIDEDRMIIYIRGGKGRKDRITAGAGLSEALPEFV